AAPPGREEFARFAGDLARQIELRQIPVVFNSNVDESMILAEKPDHIILATGSSPWIPELPGLNLPHVVNAWDVLENKAHTGTRVVIIGGGAVGVETALFLAEKGTLSADMVKFLLVNQAENLETLYEMATKGSKKIILIEMLDKIGKDIGKSTKWGMMQDLGRFGIRTMTNAKVVRITPQGLETDQGGQIGQINADTVVVAAGSKPDTRLTSILKNTGIPFDIIGDAQKVATAFDAVHSGYQAGVAIE
ncbi:MAG: FAD-dependent oxidoreductase, partial [Desulfobacula sp.]